MCRLLIGHHNVKILETYIDVVFMLYVDLAKLINLALVEDKKKKERGRIWRLSRGESGVFSYGICKKGK